MLIDNFGDAVGIANYVFGVLSGLIIALAVFLRLRSVLDHQLERRFLRGVGLVGLGWFCHQSYWLTWRVFEANGASEAVIWMVSHSYLVTPFYALIGLGALKCFSVVVIPSGHVPFRYIVAAIFVWVTGFFAGVLAS